MAKVAEENSIKTVVIAGVDDFTQFDNFIRSIESSTNNMSDNFFIQSNHNVTEKERPSGKENFIFEEDESNFVNQQQRVTVDLIIFSISDLDNLISRITNAVSAVSDTYDIKLIGWNKETTGDPPPGPTTPLS